MVYRRGNSGKDVLTIQELLTKAGFPVVQDGLFGAQTEKAVMDLQRKCGIKVDGIVGDLTLRMLSPFQVLKSKRVIKEIIVHCTATREGQNVTVSDVDKWHRSQGWNCIGYHYLVYLDGSVHAGRDVDVDGAHAGKNNKDGKNHNKNSIAVCYVGGLDANGKPKDTRTVSQKIALVQLLKQLRVLYPSATIVGHNYWSTIKACPCFDAKEEYKKI